MPAARAAPLEKLISLPDAESFLKVGTTLNQLKAAGTRLTGNQAAQQLKRQDGGYFNPSIADPDTLPDDSL